MGAKLSMGHVWPRDPKASCVVWADWLDSMSYMSDADFRQAMTIAIKYSTEGLTTEDVMTYIRALDSHLYHQDIILFWFLGVRGAIDTSYDEWQRKRNGAKAKQERTKDV